MALDKNAVAKEAQKFAAKGQYDKAIAEWKKIIKVSPNDANVFNTIGDLCLKKDAKADAVDAYKKAADILAADGFTSKAIALYKKVLNIDPKKIEIHLALGDLNAEKGLTGNALESYKHVADHYMHNDEKARALGIYQKMADLNSANVAFRIKLAEMYAKEGMKKDAVKAYLLAANVHIVKESFQDARQLFEKVLSLEPENKEVYYKAGLVYFKEGKFTEACKALKPAFEADPSNDELADLYLDALAKAGRDAEAEEVYRKKLAKDASRLDLRGKLYQLYLAKKEYDKALAEASILSDVKLENKEFDAAGDVLKGFVAAAPRHADGRCRLSQFYKTIGKAKEAASELVKAAEISIEGGNKEGAKDLLARAIELAPDLSEARQRLESLEPAAAAPEPVVEEPVIAAPAAAPPPVAPVPALGEDPAVAEAFTEVDVLIKYGLASKALEQLEGLAKKFPESTQIHARLRDLYGDQGNMGRAVAHMLALADIYAKRGKHEEAEQVLRSAQEMDPNNAEVMSRLGVAPAEAGEAVTEEGMFGAPAAEAPGFEEFQPPTPLEELAIPELPAGGELMFEEPAAEAPAPEGISFEQPFTAPEPAEEEGARFVPGEQAEEPFGMAPERETPPAAEADIGEIWAEAEFYYQQGLFDEARKHYEKILEYSPGEERASGRIAEIMKEKEEVQEFSRLAEAVDELEGLALSGEAGHELAASESDEEAVRMLMQEIAMLKQQQAQQPAVEEPVAPTPPAASAGAAETGPEASWGGPRAEEDFSNLTEDFGAGAPAAPSRQEERRETESEEFFDLASELRDELSGIAVPSQPSASSEEQSLDDIFEEFKKGVEQQSVKEDVDTHYNLGVAYKEMGLLDDAIAEFILTPEGEPKFVQSRYMLGLCYMEMGEYQSAIAELRNSLSYSESLGGEAEDRLAMHYDLGLAYQGVGNNDNASAEFQQVHDADPGYRDVASKLQEFQDGAFISLEQLKNDIEKEISSKFLEEGERIEREEKTRKNEKVRS